MLIEARLSISCKITFITFYDENPSADISAVLTALEGLSGDEYQKAITTLDADAPLAIARSTTHKVFRQSMALWHSVPQPNQAVGRHNGFV